MKKLTTTQIRTMWLEFFKKKQHHYIEAASLVPVEDPSLLWINSGVATLKPYFDGRKTPPAPRLTNSQKAIRTNDIENVGITARHHTMFEMLGNFSIGDYFKKEAISFAWELLTSEEWFDIDVNKLYITVFEEDNEAYEYWTKVIKVSQDHIFRMSRQTNFWDVGQGPCGPNTEIFFDRGIKWDPKNVGTKLIVEDIENDRYIEIWNIVFSQFNNDGNNNYTELPRKNIDTGAGLERIASIFQDTPTNFETDIFLPSIKAIEQLCAGKFHYSIDNYFVPNCEQTKINTSFKVIADHARAITFAIADGVFPGNKERSYIIRRLIRRGLIKGISLEIEEAFMFKLVDNVIEVMGDFYPYLVEKQALIKQTIRIEEEKFLQTLTKGYEALQKIILHEQSISAKNALLLFESYGYPIEQTIEIAQEQSISVDLEGFYKLLDSSKKQTRDARKDLKAWDKQNELFTKIKVNSDFTGWDELKHVDAKVVFMFSDQKSLEFAENEQIYVILDKTPFYAEKGGQAADTGVLTNKNIEAIVLDTQEGPNHEHIHKINLKGKLQVGDKITAQVDKSKRLLTMKNHSATHLIHSALRKVLGETIMQSGSYNDEKSLRMDFTYNKQIRDEEIAQAQKLVNLKIAEAIDTEIYFCSMEEAIKKYKALAFFAEKYDEVVRVIKFSDFSSELCGGTHVKNTKDIENFLITGLESKGSGVYRIKCLTSNATINDYISKEYDKGRLEVQKIAVDYKNLNSQESSQEIDNLLAQSSSLPTNIDSLKTFKEIIVKLNKAFKVFEKKANERLEQQKIEQYKNLQPKISPEGINEIKADLTGLNISELKLLTDEFKNKYSSLIVILTSKMEDSTYIVVGVTKDIQNQKSAIDIFKKLKEQPKGGGNASLAQGKY